MDYGTNGGWPWNTAASLSGCSRPSGRIVWTVISLSGATGRPEARRCRQDERGSEADRYERAADAPVGTARKEASESRLRLQTAVRLRWFGVVGQLLTVCYVYFGLGFQFDIGICLALIALTAWLNVFLRMRYSARTRLSTHVRHRRCSPTTSSSSPPCSI